MQRGGWGFVRARSSSTDLWRIKTSVDRLAVTTNNIKRNKEKLFWKNEQYISSVQYKSCFPPPLPPSFPLRWEDRGQLAKLGILSSQSRIKNKEFQQKLKIVQGNHLQVQHKIYVSFIVVYKYIIIHFMLVIFSTVILNFF